METEFSQRLHTLYRISIVGAILRIFCRRENWNIDSLIHFSFICMSLQQRNGSLKWVRLIRALIKSKLVPFYLIYSNSFGTSHSIMSLITTTYTHTKSHTMNTFFRWFFGTFIRPICLLFPYQHKTSSKHSKLPYSAYSVECDLYISENQCDEKQESDQTKMFVGNPKPMQKLNGNVKCEKK